MPNFTIQEGGLSFKTIPGVVPQIEVGFTVDFTAFFKKNGLAISRWTPEVQLSGVPVPVASVSEPTLRFNEGTPAFAQSEFSFRVLLYPHILETINSVRPGDVKGAIQVSMYYLETAQSADSWGLVGQWNAREVAMNYSRDEWNALLDKLGYAGGWTVEVVRPTITGWDTVEAKLKEAEREIRDHQAQRAAASCREAWNAARPLIKGKWESARDIINRGSKSPGEYTPKADRVASIYNDADLLFNDVHYLSDIGAHGEVHSISDDDALLIYRLSHTMLAYLSRRMGPSPGTA